MQQGNASQNWPLPGAPVKRQMSEGPDLASSWPGKYRSPAYAICACEDWAYMLLFYLCTYKYTPRLLDKWFL